MWPALAVTGATALFDYIQKEKKAQLDAATTASQQANSGYTGAKPVQAQLSPGGSLLGSAAGAAASALAQASADDRQKKQDELNKIYAHYLMSHTKGSWGTPGDDSSDQGSEA